MAAKLDEYRRKRRAEGTPEPMPESDPSSGSGGDRFVVHEHHASHLHWDLRLERDGVLVSWAVPKGPPPTPGVQRLAVHTEDHPLEYAEFSGRIPDGEYGAGRMTIWDAGTYETLKWTDREVSVILRGERIAGKHVLFRAGEDWQLIRSDPPSDPDWEPLPDLIEPMLATRGELPADAGWSYEFKWDGVRALARVEGGRTALFSRRGGDIGAVYPELAGLGASFGTTQVWLDGEIVALQDGTPSFAALQKRMNASASRAKQLATHVPVTYVVFDLLHLDGSSLLGLPYSRRRALLEEFYLTGAHWTVSPRFDDDGDAVVRAATQQHLEGVVAKRADSTYRPGERSADWIKITESETLEVVIGGWRPGEGRRAGTFGSLLLGLPEPEGGLRYVGQVGTGFTDAMLEDLSVRLADAERETSPFTTQLPRDRAREAHWVRPELVGEVVFKAWTDDGRLRAPSWRGLRPDRTVEELKP